MCVRVFSARMRGDPRIDFADVTLWRLRELHEASMRAETVFPLGPLDRETLVARIGEIHDHVADRVEDPLRCAHGPIISQRKVLARRMIHE